MTSNLQIGKATHVLGARVHVQPVPSYPRFTCRIKGSISKVGVHGTNRTSINERSTHPRVHVKDKKIIFEKYTPRGVAK
jgi:hypothetical protein